MGILAGGLTGCDLFSPAKKTEKTSSAEVTTNTAANTVSETANENASDQGPLPPDVVARVGSWTLTTDDFNQKLKLFKQVQPNFNDKDPKVEASVVDELIRQQLLVQDAQNSDIGDQKDIKAAVEDFRRSLLMQALANRITKGVVATEADALKYYDENKNIFVKWKVRQIVVADETTAKNLLVQVLQGGDFAALAKEQSIDKTAKQGGLIADPNKAPVEVQKAIAPLDSGGTSAVFKGKEGYYLVHVDEKNPVPFTEVKAELVSALTVRKQQNAILEYINKLAQKTKVEINKELLGLSDNKQP